MPLLINNQTIFAFSDTHGNHRRLPVPEIFYQHLPQFCRRIDHFCRKNKMEKLNNTSNLGIREIEGAYGLRIEQPEVTLIKIGDTSMIADAFGVTATNPEELIEKVAASFHLDKSFLTILTIAEVEMIHKTADEHPKRLRIF